MPNLIFSNIFIVNTVEIEKIPGMMKIIILSSFQIFYTLYTRMIIYVQTAIMIFDISF